MTKSKIIFDVCVEEMAQQRVIRQFGARQLVVPPPTEDPLPQVVHRFTRKGSARTQTQWLQRVQSYVTEWETATTRVWPLAAFDLDLFNGYLQRRETVAGKGGGKRWRKNEAGKRGGQRWREKEAGKPGGKKRRETVAGE